MGFGLLFIGYFFLIFFPVSRLDILPNLAIVGCIIMLFGIRKLIFYCADNKYFKWSQAALILLSAVSIASLGLDVASIDGTLTDELLTSIAPAVNAVSALAIFAFTCLLFIGVYKLSLEVELPKLAKRTALMLSVSAVYTLMEVCTLVWSLMSARGVNIPEGAVEILAYISFFALILSYVTFFTNLSVTFSCYSRICLEGDEDMPYREDTFDKIISRSGREKK